MLTAGDPHASENTRAAGTAMLIVGCVAGAIQEGQSTSLRSPSTSFRLALGGWLVRNRPHRLGGIT
jgi:hypothetical protein